MYLFEAFMPISEEKKIKTRQRHVKNAEKY